MGPVCPGCQKRFGRDPKESTFFQKELAFQENERSILKLIEQIQKYEDMMHNLLENYSLPENLQEDIRFVMNQEEEDEGTALKTNAQEEFFQQLPMSPFSGSHASMNT